MPFQAYKISEVKRIMSLRHYLLLALDATVLVNYLPQSNVTVDSLQRIIIITIITIMMMMMMKILIII